MVFGQYLLNALTKNLKIKKIKEHFERAFKRCAELYIRKKICGTKIIFDLDHLTQHGFYYTRPKHKRSY